MKSHLQYEKYWQDFWQKNNLFKTDLFDRTKPKFYVLDMFPYPSGAGLHVGHVEGYTASDILVRYKKQKGFNVFTSMGFDAFGLPAEQYALQTGNDPLKFTYKNINNFKKQLKTIGKIIDFEKSFATSDPEYYKITQQIFKMLYQKGLAELKDVDVNFCPELGTALANDEIINENGMMFSERGHFPVYKKPMRQWVLKITDYADSLLNDLESLNWPTPIKEIQKNWIGKKDGLLLDFKLENSEEKITVFTTRPDTIFGVSFITLAPENDLVLKITDEKKLDKVKAYIEKASLKDNITRQISKEKTGEFLGVYAINPFNNEKIPVYVADYVLSDFATGALMGVPCCDERDFEFANTFNLKIIKITAEKKLPFLEDFKHINSGFINNFNNLEASNKVIEKAINLKIGSKKTTYKLRDWIFSRQRYWGEPFPVYYDENGNINLIENKKLPLILPKTKNIKPSGDGKSPLANIKKWTNFKVKGKLCSYDTNTMPQLAGSSWYFFAHILKDKNKFLSLDSEKAKELINFWLPVDVYIGGREHAVGHLLYARFFTKFLKDQKIFNINEPFKTLVNQGMIIKDGFKMSKSKGNVVNPDDIIKTYGADTLRLYEMFLGPITQDKPWSDDGVKAARKFIDRIANMFSFLSKKENPNLEKILNQSIAKIENDYEKMQFNTAISQMMIFVNEVYKEKSFGENQASKFLKIINPVIPHLAEELNLTYLKSKPLINSDFPKVDLTYLNEDNINIIIQINGKIRSKITAFKNLEEAKIIELAKNDLNIQKYLENKKIIKTIYIKDKILNFVIN